MALIKCEDCGRDVSDRAPACINCGAPIAAAAEAGDAPAKVSTNGDCFRATRALLTRHAVKAVQSLNYKVDSADEASGLVSFTTGMTWGSWSGVSGSIYLEEIEPYKLRATGNAKQNVKGGQLIALDIGGEAKGKVTKVIEEMRRLAA
ncbi:MAG TPA: hypothetical protein VGB79_15730 [Allosphingosinicella sp.]|jgi:hypothetical protein